MKKIRLYKKTERFKDKDYKNFRYRKGITLSRDIYDNLELIKEYKDYYEAYDDFLSNGYEYATKYDYDKSNHSILYHVITEYHIIEEEFDNDMELVDMNIVKTSKMPTSQYQKYLDSTVKDKLCLRKILIDKYETLFIYKDIFTKDFYVTSNEEQVHDILEELEHDYEEVFIESIDFIKDLELRQVENIKNYLY